MPTDLIKPLVGFPLDGPRFYIARRAMGEDVLEPVKELGVTGGLEVSDDNKSALMYVKFPDGPRLTRPDWGNVAPGPMPDDDGSSATRGEIRALITSTGPTELSYDNSRIISPEDHKQAFFSADASMAYVNYGVWSGPITRTGGRDLGFGGSATTSNSNIAEVGSEGDLADEPWPFKGICASAQVRDEDPVPEEHKDMLPSNFRTLPKGTLIFTLWFDDGSGYATGRSAPVPLSFWFEPLHSNGQSPLPSDVAAHIRKMDQGPISPGSTAATTEDAAAREAEEAKWKQLEQRALTAENELAAAKKAVVVLQEQLAQKTRFSLAAAAPTTTAVPFFASFDSSAGSSHRQSLSRQGQEDAQPTPKRAKTSPSIDHNSHTPVPPAPDEQQPNVEWFSDGLTAIEGMSHRMGQLETENVELRANTSQQRCV